MLRRHFTLNVRSRESWCFPRRSQGKHQDSRENKTNWFPEGPDIKCFVIFLDFHFNSNKRITGANQNSRLGTYSNTNLILKTTEWMIYKVPSLHYLHHFPPIAAVFLLGTSWGNFKNRCFLAWGFVFVLLCSFTKKKTGRTWQYVSRLLSRYFTPCFDHVL